VKSPVFSIQNHRFGYYCILHYTEWLHFTATWRIGFFRLHNHSLILTLHSLARHSRSNHWWQYLLLFYDTTFYFELTNSRTPKSLAKDALYSGAQYQGTPKFRRLKLGKWRESSCLLVGGVLKNNPEPFSFETLVGPLGLSWSCLVELPSMAVIIMSYHILRTVPLMFRLLLFMYHKRLGLYFYVLVCIYPHRVQGEGHL